MLSIVITTRNRKDALIRCVNSIRKSTYKDYELIIIDDASIDGTEKLDRKDFDIRNIKILHNPRQLMMVKSRNLGAKKASGDVILFIDDDNVIDKKMIEILVKFMSQNPDYGIVGPVMCFKNGTPYLKYQKIDLLTGMTNGARDDTFTSIVLDSEGIPNVFLIRREVFDRIGFFDEKLIQTYTEVDFALKARIAGFKCGICQIAYTYHDIIQKDSYTPRILGGGGGFTQKAYCLIRNRMVIVKRYGKMVDKIGFILFFSWFWSLIYTLLILPYGRWDLIRLYWLGWKDGCIYFATGRLINSLSNVYCCQND